MTSAWIGSDTTSALSPLTLTTSIISMLLVAFVAFFRARKQFSSPQPKPTTGLSKKQAGRLKKIHQNIETLLRHKELEVASLS